MSKTQKMVYGLCNQHISVSDKELISKFFITIRNRVITNIMKMIAQIICCIIGIYAVLCILARQIIKVPADSLKFISIPCGVFAISLIVHILYIVLDSKKQQKIFTNHSDEILASDQYVFRYIDSELCIDTRIETIKFRNKSTGEELEYGMSQPGITYDEMLKGETYRFYALDEKHILIIKVS